MRIRIEVTAAPPAWEVRAFTTAGAPVLDSATGRPIVRTLGVVSDGGDPFPLPPPAEGALIPAGALHKPLCTATSTVALEALHERVVTRAARGDDVEAFGRYLFAVLIGDALWGVLRLPGDWLDLVVAIPGPVDQVRALTRLPWELMHGPTEPLAGMPRVSITREIVPRAPAVLDEATRPPRVLFVVGTELHRDVIRPGAEYLQLVRGLRASQLTMQTHLVCRATADRVALAVERLRPDVVQFICHGGIDPGTFQPYLELVDESSASKIQKADAAALVQMLRGLSDVPLPRMVVLSACHSATDPMAPVGQVGTPLAQQLVEAGVPVVVGMAGPIADQTCRLFTRQFYEAIVTQEDIAHATALGRRAAIAGGANLRNGADWAFPTMFVARGVAEPRLRVVQSDGDKARRRRWHQIFSQSVFGTRPIFCDRLEVFERFDALLADEALQAKFTRGDRAFAVLAVEVPEADQPVRSDQTATAPTYGRSWLLRELASKACADGHLAVLVSKPRNEEPQTYVGLLEAIQSATLAMLVTLGLEDQSFDRLSELLALAPAAPLPASVPSAVRQTGRDEALAWALRHDLVRLLNVVRETCRPAGERCCLVLLIDDVHRMGEAAGDLLQKVMGVYGLGSAPADIRTVVGWASKAATGQELTLGTIATWASDKLPKYAKATIWRFGRGDRPPAALGAGPSDIPLEERLAYEYFLLRHEYHFSGAANPMKGLAISRTPQNEDALKLFWSIVAGSVQGVPSRLGPGISTALQFVDGAGIAKALLEEANDDDWLDRAHEEVR